MPKVRSHTDGTLAPQSRTDSVAESASLDCFTLESQATELAARSGMYRLLARLWLREVDRDMLLQLTIPPVRESFVAAGGVLPDGNDDSVIEQLAIDYCRLFLGPKNHLPPFQSVWQSGQLQGASLGLMNELADIVRYDTSALPSGLMLDHLGVQLDVMRHILEESALRPAEPASQHELLQFARAYFDTHLRWPAELLQAAARNAASDFYRSVIRLTRDFLASESED